MSVPQGIPGGLGGVSFWGGLVEVRWMITLLMVVMIYQVVLQLDHLQEHLDLVVQFGSRDFTGGAGTHGVVVVENYA